MDEDPIRAKFEVRLWHSEPLARASYWAWFWIVCVASRVESPLTPLRRKKADDIYRLGIARKASPLERLKSRHQAFLARIMAVSGQVPEDDPSPPSTAANAMRTPGRSVLGQVGSTTGVAGATQLAPSMRLSKAANGSKMEIFADGTAKAEDDAPGEWADFGTRDGRRKENTVEAGPWKGETLPQSAARSRVAPRTPKIEVFKETVCR